MCSSDLVNPNRVIVGHADTVPEPEYPLMLARRGCWVELDGFGTDTSYDMKRALRYLKALADAGFLGRVLISQDVFLKNHLRAHGGNGYAFIATTVRGWLADEGFSPEEIRKLTELNPQAALTGD